MRLLDSSPLAKQLTQRSSDGPDTVRLGLRYEGYDGRDLLEPQTLNLFEVQGAIRGFSGSACSL